MHAENLERIRHSAAHVLAEAVKRLWPDALLGIGPSIEDGFYYDFDLAHNFTPEDLEAIEAEMKKIISADEAFERTEVSIEQAKTIFSEMNEKYKLELLGEMGDEVISIYKNGSFTDLCRGPHLNSTSDIPAFKLMKVAGAYWRGDEKNKMLQRIYGTAWETEEALNEHLQHIEEAEKRDHRKLGKELKLFTMNDMLGGGIALFLPKGQILRSLIEDTLKQEHKKRGYVSTVTPHIMKSDVWKVSGHYDMQYPMYFFDIEGQEYGIKPMNCPGHIMAYQFEPRSYRDLPMRIFELGTVYRHERSGVLHGLLRVRGFTQDDAHIFCRPEQLEDEIRSVIDFAFYMLKMFGFKEYEILLSTKPDKYVGTDENWEKATGALKKALDDQSISYEIDPGEGVFYGPKIDVKLKDAIGRLWQGPTIQVDFNLPERFDLVYWTPENILERPVMIHRVVLGSMERFIGVLIEHYAGALPLWLSPTQTVILPIADRHNSHAEEIYNAMDAAGVRVEMDLRTETLNKKIRDAQMQKVPYIIVIGDKEIEAGTLSVRGRDGSDRRGVIIEDLVEEIMQKVDNRD